MSDYTNWLRGAEQVMTAYADGGVVGVDTYTPLQEVMEGEMADLVEKLLESPPEVRAALLVEFDEEEREWLLREMAAGPEDEWAAAAAREVLMELRIRTIRGVVRYVWSGARSPWQALKNFLAMVRGVMPELLNGIGVRKMALVLNETPAATSLREKKYEALAKEWGMTGLRVSGVKTEAACRSFAKAQRGNGNRRRSKEAKK